MGIGDAPQPSLGADSVGVVAGTMSICRLGQTVRCLPHPASTGKTVRHRLNWGGHRQANAALYALSLSACNAMNRPKPTSPAAPPKARPKPRSSAASNASSPEKSGHSCTHCAPFPKPTNWPLDDYRSINALAEAVNAAYNEPPRV